MSQRDLLSFFLLCAHCIFLLLKFWPIYNAGCWCAFLRTIKVALRVSGHRVPRHPRNLAVHQTARMSCKAVCTTDGWSVELLFLSFGTVTVSHHHSHLRARGVVCVCVRVCLFIWELRFGCAAGKCEHVCMVFDLDYVWAHEILMAHLNTAYCRYTVLHQAHTEHVSDVL